MQKMKACVSNSINTTLVVLLGHHCPIGQPLLVLDTLPQDACCPECPGKDVNGKVKMKMGTPEWFVENILLPSWTKCCLCCVLLACMGLLILGGGLGNDEEMSCNVA